MRIEWWWEDGYVNNIPNRIVEIDDEDLEGMSAEERDEYIDEYIQQEFQNQVSYGWKPADKE
jgi:hypothetical protein